MDLERREEMLSEEMTCGLYSYAGQDLSARLEVLRACIAGVEDERAAEAVGLSWLVTGISDALVDLGVFPIWDIPRHLKSAHGVLGMAGLVLVCLREEHASDAGPWV
jgi:hypothetical protein